MARVNAMVARFLDLGQLIIKRVVRAGVSGGKFGTRDAGPLSFMSGAPD